MGVLCYFWFCYTLLCVHSSFEIILKSKRKLDALLLLSYRCSVTINVLWLFLTMPWVGLQCVIVIFPDHTHLLSAICQQQRGRPAWASAQSELPLCCSLSWKFNDLTWFKMLINVKMPTIVGILTCINMINTVLSWVEHEKKFVPSGPSFPALYRSFLCLIKLIESNVPVINLSLSCLTNRSWKIEI